MHSVPFVESDGTPRSSASADIPSIKKKYSPSLPAVFTIWLGVRAAMVRTLTLSYLIFSALFVLPTSRRSGRHAVVVQGRFRLFRKPWGGVRGDPGVLDRFVLGNVLRRFVSSCSVRPFERGGRWGQACSTLLFEPTPRTTPINRVEGFYFLQGFSNAVFFDRG